MKPDDIEDAKGLRSEIQDAEPVQPFDATSAVEASLASLLLHRVEKVKDDISFEQQVKNNILSRLPEFEGPELIQLLTSVQHNSNASVEKILLPFMARGDKVPLLPDRNKVEKTKEEDTFKNSSKDTLQGLADLSKLLSRIIKDDDKPSGENVGR